MATNLAIVSIIDDDDAVPRFATNTYFVNEDIQPIVEVCVILEMQTEQSVVLSITTQDDTAIAPSDYTSLNEVIVFPPSTDDDPQIVCIDVSINNDNALEMEEELFLVVLESDDQRVSLTVENGRASVIITDNDADIIVGGFEDSVYEVSELDSILTVHAVQIADIERDVIVTLTTQSQTAIAGLDFMTQTTQSLFLSHQTQQRLSFDISIVNDVILENNEMFIIFLSSPDLTFNPSTATVTIIDTNSVTVRFEQLSYTFSESNMIVNLCVLSTGQHAITFSVTLMTADSGTARGSFDYQPILANDLLFNVDEDRMCTNVIILNDPILENDESFTVSLVSMSDSVIVLTESTDILITDDDVVNVNWEHSTYPVNEGVLIDLCAIVMETTERQFTVMIIASLSEDFSIEGTELTFPATVGSQMNCSEVNITSNDGFENVETFFISLTSTDPDIITGPATQLIISNFDGIVVRMETSDYNVGEGQTTEVCVIVEGGSNIPITIGVTTSPVTAEVADYGTPVPNQLVFAVGVMRLCTAITTINDSVFEDDESFTASIVLMSNNLDIVISVSTATVQIIDDDTVEVNWELLLYTVTEGTSIGVCAVIEESIEREFTIDIVSIPSQDYSIEEAQLDFQASQSPQSRCDMLLAISDDRLEENEVLSLTLQSRDINVMVGSSNVTSVTIVDISNVEVNLNVSSQTTVEGQSASICADVVSGVIDRELILSLSVTPVTAQATDYEDPPTELVINSGAFMGCALFTIVDDFIFEVTESFSVLLFSSNFRIAIDRSSTTVEIIDNDVVSVNWVETEYIGNEGRTLIVCAEHPEETERPFSVSIAAPNTVEDITLMTTELNFSPGGSLDIACTDVAIIIDNILEDSETFILTLESSNPSQIMIGSPSLTSIIITNTDTVTVSFQISQYGVDEGESVDVCAGVVNGNSAIDFTLSLTTNFITAQVTDVLPVATQLVFNVGDITACVTIQTLDDSIYEHNELIVLMIASSNPNITIDVSSTVVEIRDNDGVTVEWEETQYFSSEGNVISICAIHQEQTAVNFTVGILVPLTSDIIVMENVLEFPAGGESESRCVDVEIVSDQPLEGEEMNCLTLHSFDPDITVGADTCIIIGDTDFVNISIEQTSYDIMEGSSVTICAEIISGINAIPIFITVNTSTETAEESDFEPPVPSQLEFGVGVTTTCTNIMTIDDDVYEYDESFTVYLSPVTDNVNISFNTTRVIIINDDRVEVNWDQMQYTVSEGDIVSVCAETMELSAKEFNVQIMTLPQEDINLDSLQLAFASANMPQTVCSNVAVISDNLLEEDGEMICLTLTSNDSDVMIGPHSVTCIVIMDTSTVIVGFDMTSYNVQESSQSVTICVSLSGNTSIPITIEFSTTDLTATVDIDYKPPIEDIVFVGNGPQETCIAVNIMDDDILEEVESFEVMIEADITHGIILNPGTVEVFITGEEIVNVVFTESVYVVMELDQEIEVCARLMGLIAREVSVRLSTISNTSEAGSDFTAILNAEMTFEPASLMVVCWTIDIENDHFVEGQESFFVSLATDDNSVDLNSTTVQVIIMDEDFVTVQFEEDTYSFDEGDGSATICLVLNGVVQDTISVEILVESNTNEQDFTLEENVVSFQTVNTTTTTITKCIALNISDDVILEYDEHFVLSLDSQFNSVIIPSPTTMVIILNNDPIEVNLELGELGETSIDVEENIESVGVCAIINGAIARNVSVILITSPITALDVIDYVALNELILFVPNGPSRICYEITILDDNVLENDELFHVSLLSDDLPPSEFVTTFVTVRDDDPVMIQFNQSSYSASEEDEMVTVFITILGQSDITITLQLQDTPNTATSDDYNISESTLFISAPNTENMESINIELINDSIAESTESFTIMLISNNSNIFVLTSPSEAEVFILDSDTVNVGFTQSSYESSEVSEPSEVCVELSGETARDVNLKITVTGVTASMREDYHIMGPLSFDIPAEDYGSVNVCCIISVVEDEILEADETIHLQLTTTNSFITFNPVSATFTIQDSNEPTVDVINNTLMDISARVFAPSENQTEKNLDIISITLDNLADNIEAENLTVDAATLKSVSSAIGGLSESWPTELLQTSQNSSHMIVEVVEGIGTEYLYQLSSSGKQSFCEDGLFIQAKKVVSIGGNDLNLIYDCTCCDQVPITSRVDVTIPNSILLPNISVLFTLYQSSALFPYESMNDLQANYPVLGISSDTIDTSNLSENISLHFHLEKSSDSIKCVFYDFDTSQWLSDGCIMKLNATGIVSCFCDRLTFFTLLTSEIELECEHQLDGFVCICDSGYSLDSNGKNCSDINECQSESVCDEKATCFNTEGSYECTCIDGYEGSGQPDSCTGIPPSLTILELDINAGSNTIMPVEPGRLLNLTCISNGQYAGNVTWTKADGDNLPTQEEERGVPYRDMSVSLMENVTFSRESLVVGIGGIATLPDGENVYICTADNTYAVSSISVQLNIPALDDAQEPSSFIRFSTIETLDNLSLSKGLNSSEFYDIFDLISSLALESIPMDEPGYQEFICESVPEKMDRVECQFKNYISDLILNLETLMTKLVDEGVISTSDRIISSEDGFCDEDSTSNAIYGNNDWPETCVNKTSELECNYSGPGNNPVATRRCVSRGVWSGELDYTLCYTLITMMYQDFKQEEIVDDTVVEVIVELADLVAITQPGDDQSQDNFDVILDVVEQVTDIVNMPNTTFTDANLVEVVSSVSNILDDILIWPEISIDQTMDTNLVESLESLASVLAENNEVGENTTILSVTGNRSAILVERNNISTLQTIGREFSALRDESGLSTLLKVIESENLLAAIQLPGTLFMENEVIDSSSGGGSVGIVFTIYETPPLLFPLANGTSASIRSVVIGALLGSVPTVIDLIDPITISLQFNIDSDEEILQVTCVSWNFTAADGFGNWTDEGCYSISTVQTNTTIILLCNCSHLTNFAALVDVCSRTQGDCPNSGPEAKVLEIISYIGVSLSIVGLILTIITMTFFKKLRNRDASKLHVQLSLALLGMLVVFVLGADRTEVFEGCVLVSVLIHYFTLVAVMWMGAEALLMFQKLVIVFVQITKRYLILVSTVCWVVPLVPVIISVSSDPTLMVSYRDVPSTSPNVTTEKEIDFCFIGDARVLFGAFLVPILIILLFNCIMMVVVIRVLIIHSIKKYGHKNETKAVEGVKRVLISIFGIMFLFGMSWVFGALTISDASLVFQYLFAIFTSLQGFFIFFFFCVLGKEARELWIEYLCRGRKVSWFASTSGTPHQQRDPISSSGISGETTSSGITSGITTQRRSSALSAMYLRRPSNISHLENLESSSRRSSECGSVEDFPTNSTEMTTKGATIANLHAIQEEDEEEETIMATQTQLSEEHDHDFKKDISKYAEPLKKRYNSATESTIDDFSQNESETNTEVSGSPLGQDEALSSSLQSQIAALGSPPQRQPAVLSSSPERQATSLSTSPQFQDSPLSDISPELPDTSSSDADSEVIQNPYVEQ